MMVFWHVHICLVAVLMLFTWGLNAETRFKEDYCCFNEVFEITCKPDEVIVFENARYGRNDTAIAQRCQTPVQRNCDIDVHFTLNSFCSGKQRCSLAVNTALFGDPCGYDEFLKVKYQCVPTTQLSQDCYGTLGPLIFDHGYIASPNYPDKYYRDGTCVWSLAVQQRQTILVTIFDYELSVKIAGECTDFLEISSGIEVYFKDCGGQGKQTIEIPHSEATVRFKTGSNSLTKRGFLIYFEAVGPGCPDIENLRHGSVVYYVSRDILYANATCDPGYIFTGTNLDSMQVQCLQSYWSTPFIECTASPPNTTPIGLAPPATEGPATTSDNNSAFVETDSLLTRTAGIALGIVSALLLLILLLIIIVYFQKRRQHRKAEKERWRVVVNNLQENEINSYDEEQQWKNATMEDSFSPQCNIQKAKRKNKKMNNKEEELQGRNLLVDPGYDDCEQDTSYMIDYSDYRSDFPEQQCTPVKGVYNEPIYNRVPSRRNSRGSKATLQKQRSREGELDEKYASAPRRNQSFCVECGTNTAVRQPRPQSQKDLRHKRARSGQFVPNKAYAYTPSPDVPIYGFPRALTQSAPDLVGLCEAAESEPPVVWTLPPDHIYNVPPPPAVVSDNQASNNHANISSNRTVTPKRPRKSGPQYVVPPTPPERTMTQYNDIRC